MTIETSIEIERVEPHVFRVPIETPVVTSFGVMRDRPAVFIRVSDKSGAQGWGEVWCNFPAVGAEHRARLVNSVLSPLLEGQPFESAEGAYLHLTRATEILAIQSGEPGPIAQAIAGIDLALWDMVARRAGKPLHLCLGGVPKAFVKAYASGLNADGPERLAAVKHEAGYRRFKIKLGFGRERDLRNLEAMRDTFGTQADIMVDANQAWDVETAIEMAKALSVHRPRWLEEPIRADIGLDGWRRLANDSPIPLAAGENVRGEGAYSAFIQSGTLGFLQPDIGKWGGLSATLPIARAAEKAGVTYCPHWLGGGIGLVASLHLLAAVGGDGLLEVDANPNPLREDMIIGFPAIANGDMAVPSAAGIGVEPDLQALARYRIAVGD
ncbi:MAG: mandelate racemase/muconate lactonizing enzyme family protein [Pseudomonadota bacterium]|nr:mandelate racemase/muconate lactonizing enzyme family protein [Pseudomonadota bacterium]